VLKMPNRELILNHRVSRRQFAVGLTTLAAATTLPACKTTNSVHHSASPRLGIQLYMLGMEPVNDLQGTLHKVAAMGYRTLELPGSYGLSARTLRAVLDEAGLSCTCVHVPLQRRSPYRWSFDLDRDQLIEDMEILGAKYIGVPIFWFNESAAEKRRTLSADPHANLFQAISPLPAEDWLRTADVLNEHAEYLARSNVRLGYHNHGIEFVPLPDGRTGYDILIERSDPKLVDFQLDVGWATSVRVDCRALLERLGQRVRLVHLKDVKATGDAFSVHSTDFGTGIVSWKELIPIIQRQRIPHLFVEQEPPFDKSPMHSAQVAYDFLSRALSA
jgi:sugar phosphate isomerase/epimerase